MATVVPALVRAQSRVEVLHGLTRVRSGRLDVNAMNHCVNHVSPVK